MLSSQCRGICHFRSILVKEKPCRFYCNVYKTYTTRTKRLSQTSLRPDEHGGEGDAEAASGGFHGGRFFKGAWLIIIALEGPRSAKAYRALAGLRAPHASFRRL